VKGRTDKIKKILVGSQPEPKARGDTFFLLGFQQFVPGKEKTAALARIAAGYSENGWLEPRPALGYLSLNPYFDARERRSFHFAVFAELDGPAPLRASSGLNTPAIF
jgi:hypothetical protein